MKKFVDILMFCILTTVMGFVAATLIWLILQVIDLGIDFLWQELPWMLGMSDSLIYYLIVCIAGGVLIGLWQKKFGPLPENIETVMGRVKTEGGYPYNRLHIIAVSAILPLIFGGALGPEAGLSGLIAGMCCFIGDRLRYKGNSLAALTESGIAATLGVIFGAPLFGIVGNLEPDNSKEKYREKLVSKRTRIIIYCFGVMGAFAAFRLLGTITGTSAGLPRFNPEHGIGIEQWKWFVPLFAIGLVLSVFYKSMNKLTALIKNKIGKKEVLCCTIAGAAVALCGYFLPLTMFSGEDELVYLIDEWMSNSMIIMVVSALVKLILVNVCINMGWKGGNIFPMIYSCALIGYSFAMLTGMDGAFAVAVVTASFYACVIRKPVTAIAILLLCFPITYILPLGVAAIAASKIPLPFQNKDPDESQKDSTSPHNDLDDFQKDLVAFQKHVDKHK